MNKIILTFLAMALTSQMTMAQDQISTTTESLPEIKTQKTKGLEVGLVYSNLTDMNMKIEGSVNINGQSYNFDQTSKGGTHLGIMGLNINYKDKYVRDQFGFYFGGAYMKPINKSESDLKTDIFKGQVGLSYSPMDSFSLKGDINVSYISLKDNNSSIEYLPAAGIDLITELSIKDINLQIGYQVLGLNGQSKKSSGDDLKITGAVSGIMAQVSYLF